MELAALVTLAFIVGAVVGLVGWDLRCRKGDRTHVDKARVDLEDLVRKIGEAHNSLASKVAEHEAKLETQQMHISAAKERTTQNWTSAQSRSQP